MDGLTALVVEDDPVLRLFLRRLLERHGAEVLLANSEAEGLDLLQAGRQLPDVVVHGSALVREALGRLAERVEQIAPGTPVVTYGGATVLPRMSGRRRPLSAVAPCDAEALVQEMQFAVRRATGAKQADGLDEVQSATG